MFGSLCVTVTPMMTLQISIHEGDAEMVMYDILACDETSVAQQSYKVTKF